MTILAQNNFKVNKPIVPTLIHDETTRLIILTIIILLFSYILYRTMRYYGR